MVFYVAVHGGAGYHARETEKEVKQALRRACLIAVNLLQKGKSACDAVEAAISSLEDAECLNAGYGSNLTEKRTVECDAAIMADTGSFGGAGAVSGIKNPIRAARAVLDYSDIRDSLGRIPPLTLVSAGAHDFAKASNVETVDPDKLISPRALREWQKWNELKAEGIREIKHEESTSLMQDTVGCVAWDNEGRICSGVSR
ncbi:hypothetical protein M422DRAFT_195522 [Sphaerobolus stellatus SS14]|uniref:Beta-aspartyl-peptidase n=1 Tax=Sphaerobolus stellatus (strain SS14) TaxID=990650 RepID=A0A0C9UE65_SPHS4|nr:hypothetical protein M422DRAFT_195522 [Sphaerobolus stellatus SS14]